jgi:formimidoylglutamate deiminase
MYRFVAAITPDQLEAIATGLYVEMLEAGYTSVCEFHYVHHDHDGRPYADDMALSMCLLRASARAGIGLTLLPVLYQTSGFGASPPSEGQRRFIRSTDNMLALLQKLKPLCEAQGARLGLAPHSLRAVPPDSLREALDGLQAMDAKAPVHIHIAEQIAEVDACLAWSGQRPVEWLLDHAPVDIRWCLVHATHMSADESMRAARTGAVAGLCPSTEANLGDGIFDAASWLQGGGRWGVGSDSHACVNAAEELMLLEYSQRLATRQRNVLVTAEQPSVATAMTLAAVAGGAQASARPVAGLAAGQQADLLVLDAQHLLLRDLPSPEAMLSAHVFASHRQSALLQVWVGGRLKVQSGRHALHDSALSGGVTARQQLLKNTP